MIKFPESSSHINNIVNRRAVYRACIKGTLDLIVVTGRYKISQMPHYMEMQTKMNEKLDELFTWLIRKYDRQIAIDKIINLFKQWEYHVDVTDHYIYDIITTINIGDIDDFIEFLDKQKQFYGADTMPTETELLQFLTKGDD